MRSRANRPFSAQTLSHVKKLRLHLRPRSQLRPATAIGSWRRIMPASETAGGARGFRGGSGSIRREFPHREHVRVKSATSCSSATLFPRRSCTWPAVSAASRRRPGEPQVYHETITAAFLALIGERRLSGSYADFQDFAERNPDLFCKELLSKFYEPAVLQSSVARQTFVLPNPID